MENATERINLFVKAFSAEDNTSALALISQAKSLVNNGPKLLQAIKSKQVTVSIYVILFDYRFFFLKLRFKYVYQLV